MSQGGLTQVKEDGGSLEIEAALLSAGCYNHGKTASTVNAMDNRPSATTVTPKRRLLMNAPKA